MMSVYVDDMESPFRGMVMCHMTADSIGELFEMVDRIKVARKWVQKKDTYKVHFDICKSKRRLAIEFGAIEISTRNLVRRMRAKRTVNK